MKSLIKRLFERCKLGWGVRSKAGEYKQKILMDWHKGEGRSENARGFDNEVSLQLANIQHIHDEVRFSWVLSWWSWVVVALLMVLPFLAFLVPVSSRVANIQAQSKSVSVLSATAWKALPDLSCNELHFAGDLDLKFPSVDGVGDYPFTLEDPVISVTVKRQRDRPLQVIQFDVPSKARVDLAIQRGDGDIAEMNMFIEPTIIASSRPIVFQIKVGPEVEIEMTTRSGEIILDKSSDSNSSIITLKVRTESSSSSFTVHAKVPLKDTPITLAQVIEDVTEVGFLPGKAALGGGNLYADPLERQIYSLENAKVMMGRESESSIAQPMSLWLTPGKNLAATIDLNRNGKIESSWHGEFDEILVGSRLSNTKSILPSYFDVWLGGHSSQSKLGFLFYFTILVFWLFRGRGEVSIGT